MDWQQWAALVIVAAAAIWLIRTQILAPRRSGCGGCGSCPAAQPPVQPVGKGVSQLVQIDLDMTSARKQPDPRARSR